MSRRSRRVRLEGSQKGRPEGSAEQRDLARNTEHRRTGEPEEAGRHTACTVRVMHTQVTATPASPVATETSREDWIKHTLDCVSRRLVFLALPCTNTFLLNKWNEERKEEEDEKRQVDDRTALSIYSQGWEKGKLLGQGGGAPPWSGGAGTVRPPSGGALGAVSSTEFMTGPELEVRSHGGRARGTTERHRGQGAEFQGHRKRN